jgi:hypothetical protein
VTTQVNWAQLCQVVNAAAPTLVYTVASGAQLSISAASAWNPVGAAGNAVVDLFAVPASGAAGDPTHLDRVSVPPGAALSLTNAINHKLTGGMELYAITNGATLTISGAVAS